jgi:beta-glucanase (GH16 family)
MHPVKLSALAAAVSALLSLPLQADDILWSDEFNEGTTLDERYWSYDLGGGGWGNSELQEYTSNPENVRIEDGHLVIAVHPVETAGPGIRYTSARIKTENKLIFRYGTIEARIKVPDLADGLWPAFWTLGNNFSRVGWPFCGELDIMEMGSAAAITAGVTNRRVGSTAHWDADGRRRFFTGSKTATEDLNDDFHLFRMEWTPDLVTTYLDGERIWAIDIGPDCPSCSEFQQAHFLILNVAVGGTYTQRFSSGDVSAPLPAEMRVDYVRIMDNGFTELGGSALEAGPFIAPVYSGSWFNDEQSGHGFSIEVGTAPSGFPQAVVYWYSYDSEGEPLFMVGSGVPDGNRLEIDFTSPTGMVYGEFDPATVDRPVAGRAVFEFEDQETARFRYTPSAFSEGRWGHDQPIESLPLRKLFAIPAAAAGGGNE